MTSYRCKHEIDVDADSSEDAAQEALLTAATRPTVFLVSEVFADGSSAEPVAVNVDVEPPAKNAGIFVANDDGTYFCSDCIPDTVDVSLDSVQVWEVGSHGWTGQPKCCVCHLSIEVYVDGEGALVAQAVTQGHAAARRIMATLDDQGDGDPPDSGRSHDSGREDFHSDG